MVEESEPERLSRWAQACRKAAESTRQEAYKHGPEWPLYDLTLKVAAIEDERAFACEIQSAALDVLASLGQRDALRLGSAHL